MDPMRFDRKLILAKIEAAYGTDAAPGAATDAILTRNFQFTPLTGDRRERPLDLPATGNRKSRLDNQRGEFSFEVEATGAGGAAQTPVAYGMLLRACGLAETIDTTPGLEKVTYSRIEEGFESVTLYAHMDKTLHKLPGSRLNLQATLNAGEDPFFAFSGSGLFLPVSPVVLPTNASHTAFQDPEPVNKTNTTVTLAGQTLSASQISFNLNNDVSLKTRTDQQAVRVLNQGAEMTLVFEAPDVATVDFFDKASKSTIESVTVAHGSAAGKIVEVSSAACEIGEPSYEEDDGDMMLSVPMRLISDGVTADFTLTTK